MASNRFTEEMDYITQCCICTEFYTKPKVLPCIHTFCLNCLETYAKDKDPGDKETCPLCKQEFTIPPGGLVQLPNNFHVDKLIKVRKLCGQDTKQQKLMCDNCSESNESDPTKAATWDCLDCVENLCCKCCKNHQNPNLVKITKCLRLDNKTNKFSR